MGSTGPASIGSLKNGLTSVARMARGITPFAHAVIMAVFDINADITDRIKSSLLND
jgi:hypothetical protein